MTSSVVSAKSSVGTHHNCFSAKKLALGKIIFAYLCFCRFCKLIHKELAPWWCRRPLRGTPRTLRDVEKSGKRCPKCAWHPTGVGQKTRKEMCRHASRSRPVVGRNTRKIGDIGIEAREIRWSCCRGFYMDFGLFENCEKLQKTVDNSENCEKVKENFRKCEEVL